jgi:hypothetical protein
MGLLRYAPHLNMEKLKVNKFVFGIHSCEDEDPNASYIA